LTVLVDDAMLIVATKLNYVNNNAKTFTGVMLWI
jgi:hypothetical protein